MEGKACLSLLTLFFFFLTATPAAQFTELKAQATSWMALRDIMVGGGPSREQSGRGDVVVGEEWIRHSPFFSLLPYFLLLFFYFSIASPSPCSQGRYT
jgi:hypothetical protein